MNDLTWSFAEIWNKSLDVGRVERELVKRDYIYATEIGGSMIDRFLKMNAVKPTNPPNERSKRKFDAGDLWEFITKLILIRAGILVAYQGESLIHQYEGLLPVHGRLDFIAGGKPDYEKARKDLEELEKLELPSFIIRSTTAIIDEFQNKYPDGLKEIVIENKSCGVFMFNKYERSGRGNPNHEFQLLHYLLCLKKDEGHLVYNCKDDCRILEIGVFNPSPIEDKYKEDIETLSKYFYAKEEPPKERFIVFDNEFGRFSANWKVAYSPYLTMLYGFENQFQFDNIFKPKVMKWNRVLGRVAKGETMTRNNLEAIDEMRLQFNNVDEILEMAKKVKFAIEDGGVENGQ